LLPAAKRELLLKTWNMTEMEYPEQLCVHQLFEQQMEALALKIDTCHVNLPLIN
jgi:hypothetical protein